MLTELMSSFHWHLCFQSAREDLSSFPTCEASRFLPKKLRPQLNTSSLQEFFSPSIPTVSQLFEYPLYLIIFSVTVTHVISPDLFENLELVIHIKAERTEQSICDNTVLKRNYVLSK